MVVELEEGFPAPIDLLCPSTSPSSFMESRENRLRVVTKIPRKRQEWDLCSRSRKPREVGHLADENEVEPPLELTYDVTDLSEHCVMVCKRERAQIPV